MVICHPLLGLDITSMHAKFNHSTFSRSGDMVGGYQNLNGSRDLTTPNSGMTCYQWASTCYDQPSTIFEVFISTHYEDTKGDTKSQKWGGLG